MIDTCDKVEPAFEEKSGYLQISTPTPEGTAEYRVPWSESGERPAEEVIERFKKVVRHFANHPLPEYNLNWLLNHPDATVVRMSSALQSH